MMRHGILITNGSDEHPISQNDDGSCAAGCLQAITKDGYLMKEAVLLGLTIKKMSCAFMDPKSRTCSAFLVTF